MPSIKYRDPKTHEFKRIPMVMIGDEGPSPLDNFVYDQVVPAEVWNITHNMSKYPSVTIINSANERVFADVVYIDDQSLQIKFSAPMSGRATLN